jgi:ubiquinone/menaquinone biosynthesis C-methylase UbiE
MNKNNSSVKAKGGESSNVDMDVVFHFGKEWKSFDQSALSNKNLLVEYNRYFSIFPWSLIPEHAVGFDAGCGSGRWAKFVAPKVLKLHCIDPSEAIDVAKKNLTQFDNCIFHKCDISNLPFSSNSMDFGYSLGVLHHIPDTQRGLNDCVNKLKKGAPFLVYLYYYFDNQPLWYRWMWRVSDLLRRVIYRLPHKLKLIVCFFIAISVYYPLARFSKFVEYLGYSIHSWPLSNYRNQSFYSLKTDALDRFGTKLEKRFTKLEITEMMKKSGLKDIKFSQNAPFYSAVGFKA